MYRQMRWRRFHVRKVPAECDGLVGCDFEKGSSGLRRLRYCETTYSTRQSSLSDTRALRAVPAGSVWPMTGAVVMVEEAAMFDDMSVGFRLVQVRSIALKIVKIAEKEDGRRDKAVGREEGAGPLDFQPPSPP